MLKNPIKTNSWLIIVILVSCITLLISGLSSELHLGDEIHHYRFAKDMYNSGERPLFDQAYGTGLAPGYIYNSDPLWSAGLAVIWKVIGVISFPVTQVYHTFYFILLVLASYLLAKDLYSEKNALFTAIIVSTIPMVVVFSILFYTDVPITALSVLCFLLVLKRSYLWAGVVFGLMYLAKKNGCFFLPILILMIFWGQEGIRPSKRIKSLLLFLLPAILIISADVSWKQEHFSRSNLDIGSISGVWHRVTNKFSQPVPDVHSDIFGVKKLGKAKKVEYLNSSLTDPKDLVKYMGFSLLAVFVSSLFHIKRGLNKKELALILAIITYLGFYCLFFKLSSDIRYICPIIPFLAILGSRYIGLFDRRWVKIAFLLICFSQLVFTAGYVNTQRRTHPQVKEAFSYIKQNVPEDALILYPEQNILEATKRRMVWGRFWQIEYFFWPEDEKLMQQSVELGEIDYIVIKKSRVYDDSNIRHFGGYPKSFVDKLPSLAFVKLVFENERVSVWKVVLQES
jgi:4-amino-4-deoxy-L-arabinose transferase-like glycosyltransferase